MTLKSGIAIGGFGWHSGMYPNSGAAEVETKKEASPEQQIEFLKRCITIHQENAEKEIAALRRELDNERAINRDWRRKPFRVIFWNRYHIARDKILKLIFGPTIQIYDREC